ncbi:hypothetical protein [Propionivibrio dicarboxylicus]|uniref:Uncharacterized protein n=1 Tax=Propionivibrio dicarboxylicus TaxID=83767 RepID=A0A1G8DVG1_9RHOO|nr:hypothetical protein [Propionivibrio dicarboxylicus]SDH61568.1 hypothetical protein SAMN05660652_01955 [Propionivibrio dicarboxylicus]
MKEFILGILPGAVFFYRYSPRFSVGRMVGLLLMEFAPYLLIAVINSINVKFVLFGFVLVYGIYDFGYLHNDYKAEKERSGATIRSQFSEFNYLAFAIYRVPVVFFVFYYLASLGGGDILKSIAITACIVPFFIIHNELRSPRARIITFIVLNGLKIVSRIILLGPNCLYFVFSAMPHLVIKLLHYLGAKEIVLVDDKTLKSITLQIYFGFLTLLLFVDPFLVVAAVPYFLNHAKSIFRDFIKVRTL